MQKQNTADRTSKNSLDNPSIFNRDVLPVLIVKVVNIKTNTIALYNKSTEREGI